VVRLAEETGERRDGLEQQRVEFGLLFGGALSVEAGDEPISSSFSQRGGSARS
jgi:hypothetical protein